MAPTIASQDAAHYRARHDGAMQTTLPRCSGCDGFCIAALFPGHQFLENSHVAGVRTLSSVSPPARAGRLADEIYLVYHQADTETSIEN